MMPTTVFVSYSHQDASWKERLVAALREHSYSGELDLWDDTRLCGGDIWRDQIEQAIAVAKVALLLLSNHFLESAFIRDEELPRMYQSRIGLGTRLVPVLLGEVNSIPDWLNTLQRLPAYGATLSSNPSSVASVAKEILNLTRIEALPYLPFPGSAVPRSYSFAPVSMLGLKLNSENPFRIQFMIDPGDAGPESRSFRSESERLIRYFLVGLSVPESNIWVNLSPQESDRVIAPDLRRTELGRDLLAQDYLLKQFNASSIHPDSPMGERYWKAVHERTRRYGEETAANAFSRVWIVPRVADVIEQGPVVVISRALLGAEVRTDDVAVEANSRSTRLSTGRLSLDAQKDIRDWASRVFAQVLLPELEAELNDGRHFAVTRQAFGALILARWFKLKVKGSLLADVVRSDLVPKITVDEDFAAAVFQQYLCSYETGVMNFIREDYDPSTQSIIPRKYFSGGFILKALKDLLAVQISPSSFERQGIPTTRAPFWLDTEFVSVEDGSGRGVGYDLEADPGGIDLDLSRPDRIRTIRVGNDPDFRYSPEGTAEFVHRRGRAVVPIIRDIRRVSGLH